MFFTKENPWRKSSALGRSIEVDKCRLVALGRVTHKLIERVSLLSMLVRHHTTIVLLAFLLPKEKDAAHRAASLLAH